MSDVCTNSRVSAAVESQVSLDENEEDKQGDSWICADHANSTSKKVIFREMIDIYENFEEICLKLLSVTWKPSWRIAFV